MSVTIPVDAKALAFLFLVAVMPGDVRVGASVPGDSVGDRELPFLGFEVVGGSRLDRVTDAVHVSIRSWAASEERASEICREAYGQLLAAPEHEVFESRVRKALSVGGPVFYPDPDSSVPRYQATVEWQLRPEVVS